MLSLRFGSGMGTRVLRPSKACIGPSGQNGTRVGSRVRFYVRTARGTTLRGRRRGGSHMFVPTRPTRSVRRWRAEGDRGRGWVAKGYRIVV